MYRAARRLDSDYQFDLNQPEKFPKLETGKSVNVFIHAAAANENGCREKPYESVSQNVIGTKAALDFCVANNIKHFVYISTFHVFGDHTGYIDELTSPKPQNDYGLSHLQAEEYVQMYTRLGYIKGLVIRPSNLFGVPEDLINFKRWTLVPFAFCKEAVKFGEIRLNSPGLQERNFVSILDVCKVIYEAISKCEKYPLLHIPGPETMNIKDLANLVQTVMNKYYQTQITVKIPESTSAFPSEKLNFRSIYLDTIYKPVDKIEQHIIQLCGKLRGDKYV